MDAFVRAAGQDFDVGFLGVFLVKELARYGSGDGANLHRCAHAAVQNGVFCGVDFGAEDGGGLLPAWYLELHGAVLEGYVVDGVVLRVGRGAAGVDVIGADAQCARECVGDGEVDD